MNPRVEVTIGPDGSVSARTVDVTGQACLPYIALLEQLLDARTVQSAFTPEYHVTTEQHQQFQVEQVRESGT